MNHNYLSPRIPHGKATSRTCSTRNCLPLPSLSNGNSDSLFGTHQTDINIVQHSFDLSISANFQTDHRRQLHESTLGYVHEPLGQQSTVAGSMNRDELLEVRDMRQVHLGHQKRKGILSSRYVCIRNLPPSASIWTLREIFKTFGDVKTLCSKYLSSNGLVICAYYDIRDAAQAVKALRLGSVFAGHSIEVNYCSISALPMISKEYLISEAKDSILYVIQTGKILDNSALRLILETFGDVCSFHSIEDAPNCKINLVEFYDERHADTLILDLHGKLVQGTRFDIFYHTDETATFLDQIKRKITQRTLQSISQPIQAQTGEHMSQPWTHFHRELFNLYAPSPFDFKPLELNNTQSPRSADADVDASVPREFYGPPKEITEQKIIASANGNFSCVPSPRNRNSLENSENLIPGTPPFSSTSRPTNYIATPSRINFDPTLPQIQPQPLLSHTNCQYLGGNEIDLHYIARGLDTRTTFMIRNIPNKYTQDMLIESLNETHKGCYDFLYLRIDFKNKCNVGYAFINFVDPQSVISFAEQRVGRRWTRFNSEKRCILSYANIQGKQALIEKFRNSSVMDEDKSYRPKIFQSSGPHRGEEEPFPSPTMSKEDKQNLRVLRQKRFDKNPKPRPNTFLDYYSKTGEMINSPPASVPSWPNNDIFSLV